MTVNSNDYSYLNQLVDTVEHFDPSGPKRLVIQGSSSSPCLSTELKRNFFIRFIDWVYKKDYRRIKTITNFAFNIIEKNKFYFQKNCEKLGDFYQLISKNPLLKKKWKNLTNEIFKAVKKENSDLKAELEAQKAKNTALQKENEQLKEVQPQILAEAKKEAKSIIESAKKAAAEAEKALKLTEQEISNLNSVYNQTIEENSKKLEAHKKQQNLKLQQEFEESQQQFKITQEEAALQMQASFEMHSSDLLKIQEEIKLYEKKLKTLQDLAIFCEDSTVVYAHSEFLSCSEMVKKLVENDKNMLRKSEQFTACLKEFPQLKHEINLGQFSSKAVKTLIDWSKNPQHPFHVDENAIEIFDLMEFLQFEHKIKKAFIDQLKKEANLNISFGLELLKNSVSKRDLLTDLGLDIITRCFDEIETKDLIEIPQEFLIEIAQRDELSVYDEQELVENLLEWAKHEASKNEKSLEEIFHERKGRLGCSLLYTLRLNHPKEEIVQLLLENGVFSKKELEIVCLWYKDKSKPLDFEQGLFKQASNDLRIGTCRKMKRANKTTITIPQIFQKIQNQKFFNYWIPIPFNNEVIYFKFILKSQNLLSYEIKSDQPLNFNFNIGYKQGITYQSNSMSQSVKQDDFIKADNCFRLQNDKIPGYLATPLNSLAEIIIAVKSL